MGVTGTTAPTRIYSVFAKTGTATPPELVRLVHHGPAAIGPLQDNSDLRTPVDLTNEE